ncbi:MAG: lytic transglycosylase domain-containing protein [bacterium]|nr:lytic transglycosylase domain-containing protein [bacterium]
MVDSISPDVGEVQKPPQIARRQFLGMLGGFLGALAAKKAGLFEGQSQAPIQTIPPADVLSVQPTVELQPQITPAEEPLLPLAKLEKKSPLELVKQLLFPSSQYLTDEAEEGVNLVLQQIEFYKEFYKDKAIGPKEIAERVNGFYSHIEEMADSVKNDAKNLFKGSPMKQEQFQEALPLAAKLLPGLIFAESQGDPQSVSKSGAIGLCQLMPKTIREYAILLNISFSEKDFQKKFSEEKMNIYLGLIHLARMLTLFPDPGIALWAYHLGEGEMRKRIVELYSLSVIQKTVKDEKAQKEKIEGIDKVLRDKNKIGTAVLMNEYGINFIRVMDTEFITAQFQGKEHDSTLAYVKNVGAGLSFLQEHPS